MEEDAPQLSNAVIGFAFSALGLLGLWIARLREQGKIGPRLTRFARSFKPHFPDEDARLPEEEWDRPEPPKRSKWLFLLSWWDRVPDVSRGPVALSAVMFTAAIGFWVAALVTGK